VTSLAIVAKITPEGGRIAEISKAAFEAGASAVSSVANRLGGEAKLDISWLFPYIQPTDKDRKRSDRSTGPGVLCSLSVILSETKDLSFGEGIKSERR